MGGREGASERRGSVSWRLGLEGSAGPWAGLGRRVRWAAAGEAVWVGPSGEEMARGLAGFTSLFSLSYIFFSRKQLKRRKRKRGLGKGFAHGDNFPGLTKMRLF